MVRSIQCRSVRSVLWGDTSGLDINSSITRLVAHIGFLSPCRESQQRLLAVPARLGLAITENFRHSPETARVSSSRLNTLQSRNPRLVSLTRYRPAAAANAGPTRPGSPGLARSPEPWRSSHANPAALAWHLSLASPHRHHHPFVQSARPRRRP